MEKRDVSYQNREQLIMAARASCLERLERPVGYKEKREREKQTTFLNIEKEAKTKDMPSKKWASVFFQLFLGGLLFLFLFVVKEYQLTYKDMNYDRVKEMIAENHTMKQLEAATEQFVEENVIPVFQQNKE